MLPVAAMFSLKLLVCQKELTSHGYTKFRDAFFELNLHLSYYAWRDFTVTSAVSLIITMLQL